jgi:hypothetical protein
MVQAEQRTDVLLGVHSEGKAITDQEGIEGREEHVVGPGLGIVTYLGSPAG